MLLSFCGQAVSNATIGRTLHHAGYAVKRVRMFDTHHLLTTESMYQLSRIAAERSAAKRSEYLARISAYEPGQLVFVNESSVDRRTTYRTHTGAPRGLAAHRNAFFVSGKW